MDKMKKIVGVLLAVTLLVCFEGTDIQATGVAPRYVNTSACTVRLSYNNNVVKCTLTVTGKSGTSSISGKLKLYDVTDKKTIKNWTISKTGSLYTGSKSATVTAGHKYRLRFTGEVYDKNNVAESVSATVTKKN